MKQAARWARHLGVVALGVALVAGVVRAANNTAFVQARDKLRQQFADEQKKRGLSPLDEKQRAELYSQFPTPQITMCKVTEVQPGGTVKIEVTGKFVDGTTFLADNDAVTISNASMSGGRYTATVTVAPGQGPGFVRIHAFSPVSGAWAECAALFVNPLDAYDLAADNGWKIQAAPQARAFQVSNSAASLPYTAGFYKPGDPKPFETLDASMSLSRSASPGDDVSLSLAPRQGGAMGEVMELQKKMADPEAFMKLSDAERDALLERMGKLSEQMIKEQEAALKDPAALQRKEDEFGCRSLQLRIAPDHSVTGTVSCGKNVGTRKVTGTARPVK